MAQFDVFPGAPGKGYLLDCQSDLLDNLESRVVVPLMPANGLPKMTRLNPAFEIDGRMFVMSTQLVFAIPRSRLSRAVTNLGDERIVIISALDTLWSGV